MENNENNTSIIPIGSTGLVRVGNSIDITNKIIKEYEERSVSEIFKSVKIGNQFWMTKNLDVDCYSNGDPIPQVQNPKDWENLKTGAWCYYNNDSENGIKYGKIYNWFAINDERGLAPKGYKVASFEDWKTLFENLGEDVASYKLKSNKGWKENGNGNNESKLNIYPAGYRMYNIFIGKDDYTHIWTSTEKNENSAVFVNFNYYSHNVFSSDTFKYTGSYVRCITNKILNERNIELQDITPLALLYTEEFTSKFHTLIEAGTPIPITRTISLNLKIQQNNSILLTLFQGDIKWGKANKILSKIIIDELTVGANDFVKLDFTFEIDKNGILNVSAKENSTGKSQIIKTQTFKGLSANEIKELKENANRSSI